VVSDHAFLGFGFNDGNGTVSAYGISKMALNGFTSKLALDLKEDGILVNSVCPGYTASSASNAGGRPVEDGAASIVWACNLPVDGPTGGFFRDSQPLPF
jgi:NAD(P)-dependent dehydrogenase (short-subunit alcohol dehydrogenase family)